MKTDRVDINKITPSAYLPLIQLNEYLKKSTLRQIDYDLIKVRASIVNGCAFCIQTHIKDAIDNGETQKRIYALNAWKDSPYFDEKEKAILALTDEITCISEHGVSDNVFNNTMKLLDEEYISHVIMAIACINAWNRIGRSTLLIPN